MQSFWKKAAELLLFSQMEKRRKKIASALAIIIVFFTAYMLILPAVTLEKELCCNFEEHIHNDICFEVITTQICAYETNVASNSKTESQEHQHNEECYITQQVLVCGLFEHTHTEDCFINSENNQENLQQKYNHSDEEALTVQPFALNQSTGTAIKFGELDSSGSSYYVVYTYLSGNYYAIDGNGNAVNVNVSSDGKVTSESMSESLLWNFTAQSGGAYDIQNLGTSRYMHSYYNSSNDYGVTTGGAWSSSLETVTNSGSVAFRVKSNSNYSRILSSSGRVVFATTTTASQAAQFYLAEVFVPQDSYHVWFDGTCGGLMSLYGAGDEYLNVPGENNIISLPVTFQSPSKYDYVLNGWYDIKNHRYYKPGEAAEITKNTVFYADWVAASYDVGQNNEHVVSSLDTGSFIKTEMFDYGALFNMQAVTHSGSVSSTGHSETWTVAQNEKVPYNNAPSLGFIFRDWDTGNKHISYAGNRARLNDNQGTEITSEIIDYVQNMSEKNIIDVLFNKETDIIGKKYIGEANYLYQFMEKGNANYDSVHNGYYYYDATLNAASYNKSEERFYVYDYLERTSDSLKDSFDASGNATAAGAYSDFLPFNSPYVNNSNNKTITDYADRNGVKGNYQYDAKSDHQGSAAGNAGTNYWFGMKSEIEFYLPNDTGSVDGYGNYGNISTHGEHMNFQFHGDDDLWVFVDGKLVMDVGGLHGIMNGKIDFSTGIVTTDKALNNSLTATPTQSTLNLKEGDHTLTIYYMERGGSQSNCAIYFNIAPRYAVEITKQDAISSQKLNGAEFSVYTDEKCSMPAELWPSEEAYNNNMQRSNTFATVNGKAYFWGISPGKVYYIRETKAPDGYPITDDIVRMAMNNLGGVVCTTDSLRGDDTTHTDGFDVLHSDADETVHLLKVTLTNQKTKTTESGTTNFRVSKGWAEGSENVPESVTVYLTSNGEKTGKIAVLNRANAWSYTWTGLPEKDDQGEIRYGVSEVPTDGFYLQQSITGDFNDGGQWNKTDRLRDGDNFILVDRQSDKALSVNGGSFAWISLEEAEENPQAQWTAVADGMGFRLENAELYRIILNGTTEFIPSQSGNMVLYYYDSKLFAQNGNVYYYFNTNAKASSESSLTFDLYKKTQTELSGSAVTITNSPIPIEDKTSLSVSKVWEDSQELHNNESVTVFLLADGANTGRSIILSRENNWKGSFDGLRFANDNGIAIAYSVQEAAVSGYAPEYSQLTVVPGTSTTIWTAVQSLEPGGTYRFISGGNALAVNGNQVVSATVSDNDAFQQWQVVQYNGNYKLKNMGSGNYLYYYRSLSTSSGYTSNYTNIAFSSERLAVGNNTNRYIILSSSGVSTSTNSSSATTFDVDRQIQIDLSPTYEMTVTNKKIGYILPETGGRGTEDIHISGIIILGFSTALYVKRKKKEAI